MSMTFPSEAVRLLRSLMAIAVLTAVTVLSASVLLPTRPAGALTEAEAETTETSIAADEADADTVDPELVSLLQDGSVVYSQICSSCHQAGGTGLEGQFPPLLGNPHTADAAYVSEVINNGRQGEIVVDGVTYNGVMPSFSTLSDRDVEAVIAYIQNDFVAPSDSGATEAEPTGPVAGTELPALANMGSVVAYLLAAAVAGMVLAPRLISENSRLSTPWLDTWLKTAVIVLAVIFFTVYVPDWVLKRQEVAGLGRFAQDFIGVTMWTGGLAVVLGGLWYAHRQDRI